MQQPSGAQHQQRAQQQRQERRSTTGAASQQNKGDSKAKSTKSEPSEAERSKGPASSEKKDQNAASKPSTDTNRSVQSEKSKREGKSTAEQNKNTSPSKSTAGESQRKSTASEQNKADQSAKPSSAEAPKSSTQKQENASTPSSNTNNKANATNNTTNNSTNPTTTTNNSNAGAPNRNAATNAAQIDPHKKLQISETISRTRDDLAPPVRDLNVSIAVGQRVPSHVHLRPLPREIVTIAPEYRGYVYFTTEEDVVIVSPRTHEIVTEIPRDASRARAEVGNSIGSSSTTTAMSSNASTGGAMPCQVMQRTASGDMKPMDPSQLRQTTGSGGQQEHLAVTVQGPNGQQMPQVTLPDRQGRIIAETNGSDCRIIIEPGQTNR